MPGAGKSLASTVAKQMHLPVFVSGDVIRREAARRGLAPTRTNLGRLMLKIREREGMGAVANHVRPMIQESSSRVVVYEGARNMEEIDELTKRFQVTTIAIQASARSRYRRLLKRRRSDQPRGWGQFLERDLRELKVGLGSVIALADRTIENEGTKIELRKRTRRVFKEVLEI